MAVRRNILVTSLPVSAQKLAVVGPGIGASVAGESNQLPPADLPTYSNEGTSPYTIGVHKPAGASAGYNVLYGIGGAALAVASSFPFNLVMASAAQNFQLFANDTGKSQSALDQQSWNSLFV